MKRGKDLWEKRKNTLSSRVLFGMFAITLAVLTTVSVILFFWFRSQTIKEYRRLTHATISNIDLVFDNDIKSARNMLTQWFYSSGGTLGRLDNDYYMFENMDFVENVRTNLGHIPYMHSAYIFNRERKLSFLVESGISYTGDITEILMEELGKKTSNANPFFCRVPNRFGGGEDISLLTLSMWEKPVSSSGFTGAVLLNIDAVALSKNLFSGNIGDNMELFIVDEKGRIIAHSTPEKCGENLEETELMQMLLNENEEFVAKLDGKKWEFNCIPSMQKGFYVVAQSDYRKGMWQVSQIATMAFLMILAAAAVIIAVTWPVCKRIFQPFEEVILDMKKTADITESGDEVKFLSQYYRNTQESIRLLNSREEDSFIVKNLLAGSQSGAAEELLLRKGVLHSQKGYFMAIVYIQDNADEVTGMQEYDMLRQMIREIFLSSLEKAGYCCCYELGVRRLLFLISEKEHTLEKEEVYADLRRAQSSVWKRTGYALITVLSQKAENGLVSCTQVYRDISGRLRTGILLGDVEEKERKKEEGGIIACPEDISQQNVDIRIKAVVQAVKDKNEEAYLAEIHHIYKACGSLPYEIFSSACLSIAMQIVQIREKAAAEKENVTYEKLRRQLDSIQSEKELTAWFAALYRETFSQLQKVNSHSNAIQMADAVDYIRNNYDDCMLNANLLADRLHLSAPYFGKLFREFAGCSVVEYITEVRMQKAHDLLLAEPGKDVGEIAGEVGYSNNAYFATVFRKYFGVSPSKLRDYHAVNQ